MKQILIVLLTLYSFSGLAQDTKKVKEKHDNSQYTEEYYVLKSDKKIRHGNYQKLGYKNCLVTNGYYKNNEKDSTWTTYFWRTDIPLRKGAYEAGERIGIWEFYNKNSELIQKYNYDTKELIYFKPTEQSDQEFEVQTESGIERTKLDRPPMYIGGQAEAMKTLFDANLKYPNQAKDEGTSGTVWISFFIDPNGKSSEHKVKDGIGSGCDEEALRVVKAIPNQWIPGQIDGKDVTAKYLFPVKFTLR